MRVRVRVKDRERDRVRDRGELWAEGAVDCRWTKRGLWGASRDEGSRLDPQVGFGPGVARVRIRVRVRVRVRGAPWRWT